MLILAGGSGRKHITHVCQGSIVNPWLKNKVKMKLERVWYLASRIKWTDTTSPNTVFSRAGRDSWTFCTVHVDNVLAKKPDACKNVLVRFWKKVLEERVDGIGGDFNMAANVTAEAALLEASNELRQRGGSLPTVQWRKFKTSHDSMVYYQVSYNNMTSLSFRKSKRADRIQPQDVGFRKGDRDWHKPLLITFRPASGETHGDMPDACGEAAHAAHRSNHRRRSRPYLKQILPVGLQSRTAAILRANPSSSTVRPADRRGVCVPPCYSKKKDKEQTTSYHREGC